MGAVGQKNTPSEDPSCLVGSAAFTLALASPELDAGCSRGLVARRIVGDRPAPNCIVWLATTRHNTVGKAISLGFVWAGISRFRRDSSDSSWTIRAHVARTQRKLPVRRQRNSGHICSLSMTIVNSAKS